MALPSNKISKVKLDPNDNNSVYEIIPERLQKSGFEAALPTLTADSKIIIDNGVLPRIKFPVTESTTTLKSIYDAIPIGDKYKVFIAQRDNGHAYIGRIYFTGSKYGFEFLEIGGDSHNRFIADNIDNINITLNNIFSSAYSDKYIDTISDQTITGTKTFSGSIISEYIYGDGNNGLCLQDSHGDDSSLELTSSCASISGPSVSIAANGSGDIELSTAGNRNISLFSQNYSGTGKAYYKGDEIATVAGTRIEIVDLTTINS